MNVHPGEHLLLEYSAGTLATGPSLCVRAHLDQCLQCAQQVQNMNALGAAMLQECEPSELSESLFERTLEKMSNTSVSAPVLKTSQTLSTLLPEGLDNAAWQKLVGGVSFIDLPAANDSDFKVRLLRVAKGRSVFQHTHAGEEFSVLLQGGYSDELGSYSAGDFIACDAGHVHKPVAHRDQDCILLTAVSGSLRFTGLAARLLNPVLGF